MDNHFFAINEYDLIFNHQIKVKSKSHNEA